MNPDFREIFYFSENLLTGVLYDGVTYLKKKLILENRPGGWLCGVGLCWVGAFAVSTGDKLFKIVKKQ